MMEKLYVSKLVLVCYRNYRYPGCTTRTSVPSQPTVLQKPSYKKEPHLQNKKPHHHHRRPTQPNPHHTTPPPHPTPNPQHHHTPPQPTQQKQNKENKKISISKKHFK